MPTPPRWASWLLDTFGHPDAQEEVQGDLLELYTHWVASMGTRRANWRYIISALTLLRPFAKAKPRSYTPHPLLGTTMLRSYITIARRQLWRNRLFTLLNVLGLSIGLSACWIIYRLASYEFSFEQPNPNRDRIVRVVSQFNMDGKPTSNVGTPLPMADALRQQVGGIDGIVPLRYRFVDHVLIPQQAGKPLQLEKSMDRARIGQTDNGYFRMVPYRWLAGDPAHALSRPNQVVLTQRQAATYFPGLSAQQVLHKTLIYFDTLQAQVSGVVADLPYPSDFTDTEFLSLATQQKPIDPDTWGSTNSQYQLYLLLAGNTDRQKLLDHINHISTTNSVEIMKRYGNSQRWHLLQPLADKHFGVDYGEPGHRANKSVLLGLIGIAGFILLLALINYVNLASAQVPQRAREIGIRKTLGSRQRTLIIQFLGETAVITLLAFVVSFGLVQLFFVFFSDLVPPSMNAYTSWPELILFLIGLLVLVTLLAGLYPGWLIARFQPAAVLRGQTGYTQSEGQQRLSLRESLIVFQFFVAQVFIVGALFAGRQLQYVLQADMGFAREAVLTAQFPWKGPNAQNPLLRQTLKEELQQLTGIAAVSLGDTPASDSYSSNTNKRLGTKRPVEHDLFRKYVDTDYLSLYRMPLLAGRNLLPSDTVREYVLNETAVKAFGFRRPQEAIGALLQENGATHAVPIVGVVRDFHSASLREKIQPVALMTDQSNLSAINIKLASGQPADWQQTITAIAAAWQRRYPDTPFDYQFYDQTLADFYKQERQLTRIINLAMGIAILLSCLGLFGLATLTAHQRTKEIGIRKVLGATMTSVVTLLARDFVKLVLIAIVLASPLAWWAVDRYLDQFAYKVALSWWVFASAGLLSISIALVTVSFQSIKAALANPVKSLRAD